MLSPDVKKPALCVNINTSISFDIEKFLFHYKLATLQKWIKQAIKVFSAEFHTFQNNLNSIAKIGQYLNELYKLNRNQNLKIVLSRSFLYPFLANHCKRSDLASDQANCVY